jgi:hypothetical protein
VRQVRARKAIDNVISSVAYDELRNVLLPTGTGDQIHVNYLLLTQNGPAGHRPVRRARHDLRRREDGAVVGVRAQAALHVHESAADARRSRAAVRQLAGDTPVEGRIVFSMRGEFPKGRPETVIRLDELQDEFPVVERAQGGVVAALAPKSGSASSRPRSRIRSRADRARSSRLSRALAATLRVVGQHLRHAGRQPRAVSRCRNSFGPCAFDCGPSTPVTRNCVPGNFSPSMPMNGMLPPVPMYIASRPKNACEAACIDCSSHGASVGAFQPPIADSTLKRHARAVGRVALERALHGRPPPAGASVGGRRNDSFSVVCGSSTLPALRKAAGRRRP